MLFAGQTHHGVHCRHSDKAADTNSKIEGRGTIEWLTVQVGHVNRIRKGRTLHRWITAVIRRPISYQRRHTGELNDCPFNGIQWTYRKCNNYSFYGLGNTAVYLHLSANDWQTWIYECMHGYFYTAWQMIVRDYLLFLQRFSQSLCTVLYCTLDLCCAVWR